VTINPLHGRELFLTFDVEDFINERSIKALNIILEILRKHGLSGLFFVTGSMGEKLAGYEETIKLLSDNQIGYHSSSHSVRPTILEYTDMPIYDEARAESRRREGSHINPLTGAVEGRGGINFLRELFPDQVINAFRAPDYCWSPPHLQALTDLGIEFDFSTKLFSEPAGFKGITFYPFPVCHFWGRSVYANLFRPLLTKRTIVLNFHDWQFVNAEAWNHFYVIGNPENLTETSSRRDEEVRSMFSTFELFINQVKALQKTDLFEVTPKLEKRAVHPSIDRASVAERCNEMIAWYKTNCHYEPRYLHKHFETFFFET
jgi:hypothetical protein